MAVYHRTQRLQIYGEKPEVTKLFGDRYRMVVRCKAARDTEAWYNANKDQIFASFGTLYSAQMSVDGIDPRTGEAYPDMCLVSNSASYTQTGEYVITFVYETLTATWTKEQDDEVTSTDNGLRVLQRSEVAAIDTAAPYDEDDVGVATITDGGKTLYLANFQDQTGAESNAQVGRVVTRWAEAGTLSRTEDFVGSQDSLVIEAIGPDPSTPPFFSLASKQESNYEGFQTNRFTFLKNDVQLSQTEDKVGSQLAISQQWFNPNADKTIAGYSLASKNTSDFEGIKTIEFRFLKDNVILSESNDNVGSQQAIIQEIFNGTPITPDNYSIANEQVSEVDGIPTKRFTFLKNNAMLSETKDFIGSQKVISQQWFNPSDDKTIAGYSLASRNKSDLEGIETVEYRFLKDDVVLSESEDKVGSQLAIVQEVFNGTPVTPSDYSLANEQVSDFEGIPTRRYTFLKNNVELSRSEDLVGSQLAITTQVFNPTSDPTEADYSLARTEVSDVDGIPTKRYTFLKPSVLSVQQDFNNGLKRVSVQAFNLDSTAVSTALNTIITSHKLIATNESDYDGIKTTTFQYQIDESFTEDYELNGLKRISLIELSASPFTAQVIGGLAGESATPPAEDPPNVVPAGSPTIGLYLGTQDIDNGGTIRVRKSVWLEAGTLSVSKRNLSEGVVEVTTVFLVAEGTTVGPVTARSTSEFEGLQTISVTTLQDANGNSIVNEGSNTVHQYNRMVPFTYPGVVSIGQDKIVDGLATTRLFNFELDPPVQAKVEATVSVIFQTSADIVSGDFTFNDGGVGGAADGFWNPTNWASTYLSGIGWNYSPFSETQGLRGYRINTDISEIDTLNPSGTITWRSRGVVIITSGDSNYVNPSNNTTAGSLFTRVAGISDSTGLRMVANGKRLYASTPFVLEIFGGPVDPVGNKYTLDVDLRPAFSDIDGNTYYKKTIITSTIPSQ